jgi:NAD-dependent dihydropyrimidine dehydrogenase PreA subunit
MKWGFEEVSKKSRVASVASLEDRVCATNSIQLKSDGIPNIDESCIGCGICISRCPVHAIFFDRDTSRASIRKSNEYIEFAGEDEDFFKYREQLSGLFEPEKEQFNPVDLITPFDRISTLKKSLNDANVLQLLVRNLFLLTGAASRLGNPGDNNNWAELVVDDGSALLAVEIEVGSDGLDAARRVVADVALVCGRYGVSIEEVIPVVVMVQLPNVRTDFYRVVANLRERLGLRVLTVPLAVLIWSVFNRDVDLVEVIKSSCYHDSENVRDSELPSVFGDPTTEVSMALGVVPQK